LNGRNPAAAPASALARSASDGSQAAIAMPEAVTTACSVASPSMPSRKLKKFDPATIQSAASDVPRTPERPVERRRQRHSFQPPERQHDGERHHQLREHPQAGGKREAVVAQAHHGERDGPEQHGSRAAPEAGADERERSERGERDRDAAPARDHRLVGRAGVRQVEQPEPSRRGSQCGGERERHRARDRRYDERREGERAHPQRRYHWKGAGSRSGVQ
jgi:hypothetical protein